jgi:hypothetical protein
MNHEITLAMATDMTARYRDNMPENYRFVKLLMPLLLSGSYLFRELSPFGFITV